MLGHFVIDEPATLQDACALLDEHGADAAVYAGGTELLPLMKEGLVAYSHLVNIKTIAGLDKIYWCLEFVEYLEHCKHGRPDASPATKDGKVLKQQKLPPLAQGPFL